MFIDSLIVTYNSASLIEECVRHLRAAVPQARIHGVDNASSDGTQDRLKRLSLDSVRLNSSNLFLSSEWNRFLREAKTDFVLLLNPDVMIENGEFIDRALEAMNANPRIAGAGQLHCETLGTLATWAAPVRPDDAEVFFTIVRSGKWFGHQTALNSVWESVPLAYLDGCCMLLRRTPFSQ